jgi:hypothetical protein
LNSNGTATFALRPGIGRQHIRAVFEGANQYASSASEVRELIVAGRYPTATDVSWTSDNLISSVMSYGKFIPTGTVSFQDITTGSTLGTSELTGNEMSFAPHTVASINLGVPQNSIAIGDFNNDGIPDMATSNYDGSVKVLLGKGDGTFTAKSTLSVGGFSRAVTVGDFNGDGIADLAVTADGLYGNSNGTVTIFLGHGDGTFTEKTSVDASVDPTAFAVADFNGDGIPDLAVANFSSPTFQSAISILLGNGDGTFKNETLLILSSGYPNSIAAGDFNGDGIPDLVVPNFVGNSVSVFLGKGDGTFGTESQYPAAADPYATVVGDFNGDGIADLATTGATYDNNGNYLNGVVTILLGKGDGTFTSGTSASVGTTLFPNSVALGDFDGDGIADLAATTASENGGTAAMLVVLFGKGDGTFVTAASFPGSGFPLVAQDLNGDGISDLVVANYATNVVGILLTSVTATAELHNVSPPGNTTQYVRAHYSGDRFHAASTSTSIPIVSSISK